MRARLLRNPSGRSPSSNVGSKMFGPGMQRTLAARRRGRGAPGGKVWAAAASLEDDPYPEPKEPRSMRPTSSDPRTRRAAVVLLLAALAFAALFMLLGPPRGQARGSATLRISTAQNATLGKRIL